MRRGFTLLEVLVALAVFALGAIVLGSAYVNVLNAYELVQRGNQADEDLRFARGQLLAEPDHDKAEQGGDFTAADGRQVKWHATIAATATADLFSVTFVCEFADAAAGGPQTVTENFTVLRPTWADPVENGKLRQDAFDRIAKLQGKPSAKQP
jgi:general secretion pathway protein I